MKKEQANKLKHEQLVGKLAAFLIRSTRARAGSGGKIDARAIYVHQPHVYSAVSR